MSANGGLTCLLALLLAGCTPNREVSIVGDSIAIGTGSTVKPATYFAKLGNAIVYHSSQMAGTVAIVPALPAGLVWAHTGINDVRADNPDAPKVMEALLREFARRPELLVVIDQIGSVPKSESTPEREAMRDRLNAMMLNAKLPNVRVIPFVVTSLADGIHPDAVGVNQHMSKVVEAFQSWQ